MIQHYRQEDVQSMRFGTVCASTYNVQPSKKKRKFLDWKAFFTPITSQRKQRRFQTLAEQQAAMKKEFEQT